MRVGGHLGFEAGHLAPDPEHPHCCVPACVTRPRCDRFLKQAELECFVAAQVTHFVGSEERVNPEAPFASKGRTLEP